MTTKDELCGRELLILTNAMTCGLCQNLVIFCECEIVRSPEEEAKIKNLVKRLDLEFEK